MKRASSIPFDPLSPPSPEHVSKMREVQSELKDVQNTWGIDSNKGIMLLPQHREALTRVKNIAEGPTPNIKPLQVGVNNLAALYGTSTVAALNEAGMTKYSYLPYMNDGGESLVLANNPDVIKSADMAIESSDDNKAAIRKEITSNIVNNSEVIKSMIMQSLSTEDTITADRKVNELTEQLTQAAYVHYGKSLSGGNADIDASVSYAIGLINNNSSVGDRKASRGFTTINAGKTPLSFDSEIQTDNRVFSEYLTRGMRNLDYRRDYVSEFNLDDKGYGADILNDNIRSSGSWVVNPDGRTVSLYVLNRKGDREAAVTKEGKPVQVNIDGFSANSPEYKRYKANIIKPFGMSKEQRERRLARELAGGQE